jgi:hypothetical protein
MKNPFFYVLLAVLVLLDAYLLAHPNLIGRFGVFFYDYTYLETFPRALGTVAAVVGATVAVSWAVGRFLPRSFARIVAVALLILAGYWLFSSIGQFSSGVYKLTGAGFKAGAILLPGLITLVLAKGIYDVTPKPPKRARK